MIGKVDRIYMGAHSRELSSGELGVKVDYLLKEPQVGEPCGSCELIRSLISFEIRCSIGGLGIDSFLDASDEGLSNSPRSPMKD